MDTGLDGIVQEATEQDWHDAIRQVSRGKLAYYQGLYELRQVISEQLRIPELPAYYGVYIWAVEAQHPCVAEFYQIGTPGPSRFLAAYPEIQQEHGFNLACVLRDRYGYPSAFDGSALMCEAYRIRRHLLGEVNLAEKRPRRRFKAL